MYCVFQLCQINYYHTIPYHTITQKYKSDLLPQMRRIRLMYATVRGGTVCNWNSLFLIVFNSLFSVCNWLCYCPKVARFYAVKTRSGPSRPRFT